MSDVDTSREAVERLICSGPHVGKLGKLAATLRALASERDAMREERDALGRVVKSVDDALGICQTTRDAWRARAERAEAALREANTSVVAFGAPWAVEYARDHGLPQGHLFPEHYDILQKAGARMDAFTRAVLAAAQGGSSDAG